MGHLHAYTVYKNKVKIIITHTMLVQHEEVLCILPETLHRNLKCEDLHWKTQNETLEFSIETKANKHVSVLNSKKREVSKIQNQTSTD